MSNELIARARDELATYQRCSMKTCEGLIAALAPATTGEAERVVRDTIANIAGRYLPGGAVYVKGILRNAADDICAALAHPAKPAVQEGWKPIETAPKDGRRILAWHPEWSAPSTAQCYGTDWRLDNTLVFARQPTYWLPLDCLPPIPASPAPQEPDCSAKEVE